MTTKDQISYDTISAVLESWESLKRGKDDFYLVFGTKLFQRLFEISPPVKKIFGYPIDIDVTSAELIQSKRFENHVRTVLDKLDVALNMLGPDIELLMDIMKDLGSKHINYGVKPEMYPILAEAILYALEDSLKEKFTPDVRQAWVETYTFLTFHMLQPYNITVVELCRCWR